MAPLTSRYFLGTGRYLTYESPARSICYGKRPTHQIVNEGLSVLALAKNTQIAPQPATFEPPQHTFLTAGYRRVVDV